MQHASPTLQSFIAVSITGAVLGPQESRRPPPAPYSAQTPSADGTQLSTMGNPLISMEEHSPRHQPWPFTLSAEFYDGATAFLPSGTGYHTAAFSINLQNPETNGVVLAYRPEILLVPLILDEAILLRYLARHAGIGAGEAVAGFIRHIPVEHYKDSCAYHTKTGRNLPRELRGRDFFLNYYTLPVLTGAFETHYPNL